MLLTFRKFCKTYYLYLRYHLIVSCLLALLIVFLMKLNNNTNLGPFFSNKSFITGEYTATKTVSIKEGLGHIIASVVDQHGKLHTYGNRSPFIFIDGFPRSGTTLLRAMLDSHSHVRCGPETGVVREMVWFGKYLKIPTVQNVMSKRFLSKEAMEDAVTSFILQIIVQHGYPASRLCNKEPLVLLDGVYLKKLFPSSKFVMMIRDGRASVTSLIERHVDVPGFTGLNFTSALAKWSEHMELLVSQCQDIGPSSCLMVKYEDLILHPRFNLEKILNHLQLPWEESVLHHHLYVDQPNGIQLAIDEPSRSQVIEPINLKALYKWVDSYPKNLTEQLVVEIAPMLEKLGYDPYKVPPNYGEPEPS